MSEILIVFGSTSGNTELVCETIGKVLCENGHEVTIQRVENSNLTDLTDFDVTILGASTYGHGILQDHFIPFAEEMKTADLAKQQFAVVGLGDDKYDAEYNMESAVILEDIVKDRGGELVVPALMINKPPVTKLSKEVTEWALKLHEFCIGLAHT